MQQKYPHHKQKTEYRNDKSKKFESETSKNEWMKETPHGKPKNSME